MASRRRNLGTMPSSNSLSSFLTTRETHGAVESRVSFMQRMISLSDFDEYNMNEKNMQVLLRRLVLGKDEKARHILNIIENYFMSKVFDRPTVVGIYMHIEDKLESITGMRESINTRETLKDLEKQYAYAFM